MTERNRKMPIEVVDITTPALNSMLGRYFIGQTEMLNFGNRCDAWGGILNPIGSGVNLYFDIFTITNFSAQSFVGEIFLNARQPRNAIPSSTVTPSNQSICPPPKPKAIMLNAVNLSEPLLNGVNIFGRIVPPNSTLVSDSHKGSIIIPPGGTFSILLQSQDLQNIQGTIVLTWWEEKIC
ncbi:MAG: DUF6143 family protein [Eubacteriales bacterium]|nr:DUF6143 family protein [Eubacteriales bacterium]